MKPSRLIILLLFLTLISVFTSRVSTAEDVKTTYEQNKQIVRDFFEIAFNQHRPAEAAEKHMGSYYTQHNPHAANGKEAFIHYFEAWFKKNPQYRISIKRIIAEGDLVVIHQHAQNDDKDRGHAVIDIMRIENGKIVEHWDVVQAVPEKSANENTMF